MGQLKTTIYSLIVFVAVVQLNINAQSCQPTITSIPSSSLNTIFSSTYSIFRGPVELVKYIQSPSTGLGPYLLSFLPSVGTLLAFAVITLLIFLISVCQLCCFKVCKVRQCGNQITSTTYSPTATRVISILTLVGSLTLLGLCIATMIVNADLIKASSFTACNSIDLANQILLGSNDPTKPWAGISNLNTLAQKLVSNLQNSLPSLIPIFSSTNNAYDQATNPTSTVLTAASTYTCNNANANLNCPYVNAASCPSPLNAFIDLQFCVTTNTFSAASIVAAEIAANTTTWKNSLTQLNTILTAINTGPTILSSLTSSVSAFSVGTSNYETTIQDALAGSNRSLRITSIVLYVFYGSLMIMSVVNIISIIAIIGARRFAMKPLLSINWTLSFLFGFLIFIASSGLISVSFIGYDSCSAYKYYFTSLSNFNSFPLDSNSSATQAISILRNCFFNNATTIFTSFNASGLTQINSLFTNIQSATPSATFSTVATAITNYVNNQALNAQSLQLQAPNSAQGALDTANLFANYTMAGSTQGCSGTKDMFVFNPSKCFPFSVNQAFGSPSCVIASSIVDNTAFVNARVTSFTSASCSAAGTTYQNTYNALNSFAQSVYTMANTLAPIANIPANTLQQYRNNYNAYWELVTNIMNSAQPLIKSFNDPYLSLTNGNTCSFLTSALNNLVGTICNQNFPYLNAFAILNICIASTLLFLMISIYFLLPRLEFFEFLEGDFQNYGTKFSPNDTENTSRNQQLIDIPADGNYTE